MKLEEAIAGTLGSLDELEQELIEKQTELANELADVETALTRITAIRQAAIGGNSKPRRTGAATERNQQAENRERVLAYLRSAEGLQPASAIAEGAGRDARGVGAILNGLIRAGLVERVETPDGGAPLYKLTTEGSSE